ncbi:MAG: putative maltokinase [Acidobacteriaceae bacterium]|nr:putative maltokinase [Acidobacteriaceae bacterium]
MGMLAVSNADLEKVLPDYIVRQRWYRAKARTISGLQVQDVIPLEEGSHILILRVDYREGDCDNYLLPVTKARTEDEIVSGRLYGALAQEDFRRRLLNAIACDRKFRGEHGEFAASKTAAFDRACDPSEQIESVVSRAEQSNSSIIFKNRFILKVFRKLERGINPDLEIGRFLTERGFRYTPAVLGELEYRPTQGEAMEAGILQAFVRNEGDAWKYTLESLQPFFVRALQSGVLPEVPHAHPLELCSEEVAALARQTIGEYLESARLLGVRTAQMHSALADPDAASDFRPEQVTREYAAHLYEEMLQQTEITFDLVRDKQNMLSGEAAEDARALIAAEAAVRQRFSNLRDKPVQALRIRHHGDYHLGQVLWTGEDFVIIDFEGEPARPLAHRRIKTLAMRDVAGMIRSFSYAGFAALFGQVEGVPAGPEHRKRVETWAGFWTAWVSAAYLKGYFETAATAPFLGSDREEHRVLFDAFVLQKALYEVAYELNNRPDWVQIPLRGILSLIGADARRTQFA